jgi:hypothetical protein
LGADRQGASGGEGGGRPHDWPIRAIVRWDQFSAALLAISIGPRPQLFAALLFDGHIRGSLMLEFHDVPKILPEHATKCSNDCTVDNDCYQHKSSSSPV